MDMLRRLSGFSLGLGGFGLGRLGFGGLGLRGSGVSPNSAVVTQ